MKIPDVDALKNLTEAGFARVVCAALSRCDMKSPGFNLAAKAKLIAPLPAMNRATNLYREEAQGLVFSCIKALHEYDRNGKISLTRREEFIIADVRERLRSMDTDRTTPAYKAAYDSVMDYVSARMTGIASLTLAPATNDYKAAKPKAPRPS